MRNRKRLDEDEFKPEIENYEVGQSRKVKWKNLKVGEIKPGNETGAL